MSQESLMLDIIPDRTYRYLFLVNLLVFALEKLQNRVNAWMSSALARAANAQALSFFVPIF
jgi:hypothetical protein